MDLLDLAKTGIAALSTYASYKDQKKKNELQQQSYDDYMKQVADATRAAEASIAANLTPMVVSGTPTTKADVTDYTAATGLKHGGISGLRKGYARGPEIEEVEMMDEEVVTPFDLKMEEGVNIGEQVFYNTGDDRRNALMVWDAMSTPDKSIFDFDFELFFQDGGWRDMIKGAAPMPQGETQMASHAGNDAFLEKRYQELLEMNLSPAEAAAQAEKELSSSNVPQVPMNQQGIMQAAHGGRIGFSSGGDDDFMDLVAKLREAGFSQQDAIDEAKKRLGMMAQGGRIGYRLGTPDTMIADQETILETPNEEIVTNDMEEIQGQMAGPYRYHMILEGVINEMEEELNRELNDKEYEDAGKEAYRRFMSGGMATGGRAGYRYGDQVGITAIPRPVMDPRGLRSLPAMATKDGMMDLGGLEKDYRFDGGFVPIGAYEKKDDVPARLSKNEFVFTADAVRAAGGGSINKGAKRMYETMKNLEAKPEAKRMTA